MSKENFTQRLGRMERGEQTIPSHPSQPLRELARRTLPLMTPNARAEAERLIADLGTEKQIEDPSHPSQPLREVFEKDMQPVVTAIISALEIGDDDALVWLRAILPDLLAEVNDAPELADALEDKLADAMVRGLVGTQGLSTANTLTDALAQWRSRELMPTEFSSVDLSALSNELRMRSVFVARCTNADFLAEVAAVVDDMLAGKITRPTGRLRLMRKLKELGYDPAVGFPQDMADVPPAERDSLQDLSSEARLNLILDTNERIAASYGQVVAGNTPYALHAYPAWELVRFYPRNVPRGSSESHSIGWERRWFDAGESVNWEGALKPVPVALKDSPIWKALGDGAGGYQDTLGNPFPPFAWNSGKDWLATARARVIALGLIDENGVPKPTEAKLLPDLESGGIKQWFDRLPADLREELKNELDDTQERERLRIAQESHEQKMAGALDRRRAEREARHAKLREELMA